jgi:parallel beta-helix repeat protein
LLTSTHQKENDLINNLIEESNNMKKIFILSVLLFTVPEYVQAQSSDMKNLQKLIDNAKEGETIFLEEGIYEASPTEYIEDLCGNCQEHRTIVYGTKGFIVQDKSINIKGSNRDKVIIKTNAGYGFLFYNSKNSSICGVTIGGGKRDTSGNATNAGIVLKFSSVTISDCLISNDTVRLIKTPIVGISGIIIREGSEAIIRNNIIQNNTWDGIALYKGAKGYITDNIIENGRGAGIGVTWDATAIILRNRISGFWKGIGSFGTSTAVVKNNSVFNNLGWGVVISGNSYMLVENNVITRNGNCGIAPWCDLTENASGVITNNIITENGWKTEWVCPQVGVWMNSNPSRFTFSYNDVWNNVMGNYENIADLGGSNGNISVDPLFRSGYDFYLQSGSSLINKGNPLITNLDGSRSDVGIDGGQSVR